MKYFINALQKTRAMLLYQISYYKTKVLYLKQKYIAQIAVFKMIDYS